MQCWLLSCLTRDWPQGKSHPVLIDALSHLQLEALMKGTSMKGYAALHRVTSYL